jgi:hypothetical protein
MSDDEVDYDLLAFMKAHALGNGFSCAAETSTGVLESAELIYDVHSPESTANYRMHSTCQ